MSNEQFEEKAAHYKKCVAEGIECSKRITKDAVNRIHACLVPWDELDEVSAKEFAATGREVNYKQVDINNILKLPDILRAEEHKVQ